MAIGKSIFDEEGAKAVPHIIATAKARGVKLYFPVDHIIADKFDKDAKTGVTDDVLGIPSDWMALDAGPLSRKIFSDVIGRAQTVLWNGPLGVYEMTPFAGGTVSAMVDLVLATRRGATTIIGGGDTGAASAKIMYGTKPVSGMPCLALPGLALPVARGACALTVHRWVGVCSPSELGEYRRRLESGADGGQNAARRAVPGRQETSPTDGGGCQEVTGSGFLRLHARNKR
jgi:hypothetical protein